MHVEIRRRQQRLELLGLAGLCTILLLTGKWIVEAPIKAWLLLGLVFSLALIEIAPAYWVLTAILSATVSRLLTMFGAPHVLDFAHYPILVCALGISVIKANSVELARRIGLGILFFFVLNVISWLVNGGELLRPILNWLVIIEPFILIYVLIAIPLSEKMNRLFWKVLITLAFVQVPIGIWQYFFRNGRRVPDFVQGTFIGSGTGAHVAGSVALIGALIFVCRAATSLNSARKPLLYIAAIPLFGLSVIADAKQVIFCFVPGLAVALLSCTRVNPLKLFLPVALFCGIFYVAFQLYTPLQMIDKGDLISGGIQGKWDAFLTITAHHLKNPGGILIGAGPGNSVSRVALLTPDAQLDARSPIAALGLRTAPLTRELLEESQANYLWGASSAWSTQCSWLGIFGDLGLLGLANYLGLVWLVWYGIRKQRDWSSAVVRGGFVMAAGLGCIYVWLEEPGFILLVATTAGLVLSNTLRSGEPFGKQLESSSFT